jgi:hypothetical protein
MNSNPEGNENSEVEEGPHEVRPVNPVGPEDPVAPVGPADQSEDGLQNDIENGRKKSQIGENARILKITDLDFQLTTNEMDLLLSYSQHAAPNPRKIKKLYNMYSMARLLLSETLEKSLSDSDGGLTGRDKIIQV